MRKYLSRAVIFLGAIVIALRFFFPPKYIVIRGIKFPYTDKMKGFYAISDFQTALLHAFGIAVLTGIIFFFLKNKDNKY